MAELLTGTVTFLFTDVEMSTELLYRSPDVYAQALDDYRRLIRQVSTRAEGAEVDCRGEEFFFAFPRARDAAAAATAAQSGLAAHAWPAQGQLKVRMGIHTGEPTVRDSGYLGLDVHRAARICALAHGGQVLVSRTTRDLLLAARGHPDVTLQELGSFQLKGFSMPEEVFQLDVAGLPTNFPPPRMSGAAESGSAGRESELAAAALRLLAPRRSLRGLAERLTVRRTAPRGLADLGWEVRALLPAYPEPLRAELAELGGDLFSGSRSVAAVDRYLAGVDRKRLARRLAENAELGVLSKRAAEEARAAARRIALFDDLSSERARAGERIEQIGIAVERLSAHTDADPQVADIRREVRALTSRLDRALEAAGAAVKASGRPRRTRHRGIYRLGERYVVPYVDEVGIEHEYEFEDLPTARTFRDAKRREEQRKIAFPGGRAPHDSVYRKNIREDGG